MRVVASPEVADVVRARGGRLFVWPRQGRCCAHGLAWLEAGHEPKPGTTFESVPVEGFQLHVARMARTPTELTLDVHGRGRRRRVAAYWDDCAWVV
jgi:hypothetical protein